MLLAIDFADQHIDQFSGILDNSEWESWQAGLPLALIIALHERHRLTRYTVQDQDNYTIHRLGVKPGDFLADVFFPACCCARFHRPFIRELTHSSCMVHVPVPMARLVSYHNMDSEAMPLSTLAFLDDFVCSGPI